YWYPWGATARVIQALTTPGSTTARRLRRSTSRIRFMRAREMTTASGDGTAAPLRLVPAPRGTKGIPASCRTRTTCATSAPLPGSTTAAGDWRSKVYPSQSYTSVALAPVNTYWGPTMAARRARTLGWTADGMALLLMGPGPPPRAAMSAIYGAAGAFPALGPASWGRSEGHVVENRTMTDAVDCEAIRLSVITIEFRLSPTVRRLARSFARLTGIPLAR